MTPLKNSALSVAIALVALTLVRPILAAGPQDGAALGSPNFRPTAERPVGWRGDGTGHYPGATPPTTWERKKTGAGYTTKGILWMAPLPNKSVSSPIVVGERIFVTTEVADLVCLDKQTGRILWIRSSPEFDGLSDEIRNAHPEQAERIVPLVKQLDQANTEAVGQLNAQLPDAPVSPLRTSPPAIQKKREIQKQLLAEQLAIDGKKNEYLLYGAQNMFGYSGPTPASDGKRVYVFFATGVAACYDLDGNRQWIARAKGGGAEHGNFASPLLCDNKFIVWGGFETRGYDAMTGKQLWSNGGQGGNTYGSLFLVRAGGEDVAAFQSGFFTRVRDGQPIWDKHLFGELTATPVADGDMIYSFGPDRGQGHAFLAYHLPPNAESGKLTTAFTFKTDWGGELSEKDFQKGCTASPLAVDGLVYRLTEAGGLMVNDAASGDMVYRKVLPMKPRTSYWDWAGASASPTLAGKYIFLMDNQGTTVVIEPGRQYKQVAINRIEDISRDDYRVAGGKTQSQNLATPVFDGERMYYRTDNYLYCIGNH